MKRWIAGVTFKVAYGAKVWSLYKMAIWLAETLFGIFILLTIGMGTLLAIEKAGIPVHGDLTTTTYILVTLAVVLLAGGLAYYRSLHFHPEHKVEQVMEQWQVSHKVTTETVE